MILIYLKLALRHIWNSKLYSGINIFGLSLGLAACLLIGLYITNELKYDDFHEKSDHIYRVTMEFNNAGTINAAAVCGTQVGPEFKRTFPIVEDYVRAYLGNNTIKHGQDLFEENRILYADPSFFNIFSFNFIHGDPATAIDAPDKIVLTQSTAKKYFGNDNPIGQILTSGGVDFKVSGICTDPPQNSQIKFDFVTQFYNLGNGVKTETWWSANWVTYLLLHSNDNIKDFESQVNEFMDSEAITAQTGSVSPNYLHYHFEPLKKVHLYSSLAGFEPNGSITYIYIFGIIAILILIIAIANYTNLAIAQSMGRGSEIGTRKVLGAKKIQIFTQFIGESVLLTSISTVIGFLIAFFTIPFFNLISGKNFEIVDIIHPTPILLFAAFAIIVGFLAGFYPSLILARTEIMTVLKSGLSKTNKSGTSIRKLLLITQFGISIFLISLTSIIVQQVNFIKTKNIGYDREQILVLPIGGKMVKDFDILKEAFQNVNGVKSVTASYETPEYVEWSDGITVVGKNGEQNISLNAMPIDLDFTSTLGIEIAAGRDFMKSDFALMDTSNNSANYQLPYIINEKLASMIGWTPDEAIGKIINNMAAGPIVGVIKDFHFSSMHEPVGPLLQFLGRDFSRVFMIKIDGNNLQNTISGLEKVWFDKIIGRQFNYHFLDEDFDKLYASEDRSTALFKSAAILAIILASLGLFGLAAFVIVQRTKEIGIRRVLGATISEITFLLAKQFLILISISILLAVPLAWIAGNSWISDFAYKINLGWHHFVFAGLVVLTISLSTVSYHAVKACLSKPVKSLRSE